MRQHAETEDNWTTEEHRFFTFVDSLIALAKRDYAQVVANQDDGEHRLKYVERVALPRLSGDLEVVRAELAEVVTTIELKYNTLRSEIHARQSLQLTRLEEYRRSVDNQVEGIRTEFLEALAAQMAEFNKKHEWTIAYHQRSLEYLKGEIQAVGEALPNQVRVRLEEIIDEYANDETVTAIALGNAGRMAEMLAETIKRPA